MKSLFTQSKKNTIVNFLLFKVGWLTCVVLGATNYHLWGSAAVAVVVLVAVKSSPHPNCTLKFIVAASIIGFIWESTLSSFGVLEYYYGQVHVGLAPHWIVAMWALFATTLDSSLVWLNRNLLLASAFGAIGGPLAFYAGQRLGAVNIPDDRLILVVLMGGWAILTPSLVWLQNYMSKRAVITTL